jgi:hypothetical protein
MCVAVDASKSCIGTSAQQTKEKKDEIFSRIVSEKNDA